MDNNSFITYMMELSISYCIHTKVQKESDVRKGERGYERNTSNVMQL